MNGSKRQYIYTYQTINQVNGKSYIGVHTTSNLNDGYIGCGICSQKDANKEGLVFHSAVKKYGYNSFRKYILSFYDTYTLAMDEERFLVDKNWVLSKSNYNTALGGQGNTTSWMDEKRKNKWKDSIREGVNKWINNGGQQILLEKQKTAKRNRMFGSKNPMFQKSSKRRRGVIQYTLEMVVVTSYGHIHEAAEKTGFSKGNITSCCKGYYKYCNGFIFRYSSYSDSEKKTLNNNLLPKEGNRRRILQYLKDGSIVKEHKSIVETAAYLNCTNAAIRANLTGISKTCRGFILKYKGG